MLQMLAGGGGDLIDPTSPGMDALKTGLWALGIFIVVLFVLKKFAWGPIVDGLNAREGRIEESLQKAREIENATRELAETNRRVIEETQREAQQIVADARAAAKKAADVTVVKAQAEIAAQRDRLKREIQLEGEKARDLIRREAVDLTLDATALLLGRHLGDADQRRLADEALSDAESVAKG